MSIIIVPLFREQGRIIANFDSNSSFVSNPNNGFPNLANFTSNSNFVASLQGVNPNRIVSSFNFTSNLNAIINNLSGIYRFRSQSHLTVILNSRLTYGEVLNFLVDIIPSPSANTYQEYKCRFLFNGIEYPVRRFVVTYPRDSIGMNLEITLARISDYPDFIYQYGDQYSFDIGIVSGGTTTWHSILSSGSLGTKSLSIGWSQNSPTDTLNISTISAIDEKMSFSPEKWLIIYDVNRTEIDDSELRPIPSTDPIINYSPELIPFSNLTLYDIFKTITQRAGFATYKTNIPNFLVKRLDVRITDSYYSALRSLIAPFRPLIVLINDILWILDTTTIFPTGFPSPGQIILDNVRDVQRSSNHIPIDGYEVTYIENENDGLAYTEEIETTNTESGSFGSPGYQNTEIETTVRKYYRPEEPTVYVQEVIRVQETSVYTGAASLRSRNTEQFFYDSYGRLSSSEKTYEAAIPDLSSPGTETLTTVRTETESITYGPHPFEPNRQIQLKRIVRASGLIAVDSNNQYLGQDFEQDFMRAHEAGVLNEDMTSYFAPIWTVTETTKPTSNGQVKVYVQKIDHVRDIVSNTISASRTGDISLSGRASSSRTIVVLPKSGVSGKRIRIEPFNLGEIPTPIGIPLVRRIIEKNNTRNSQIDFNWIGFNPYIKRGMIQEVIGRSSSLGYYIIDEIIIVGENLGSSEQTVITTFSGEEA